MPSRLGLGSLGVGLWTMQSTAARPRNLVTAYRDLARDARRVEELGFHSLWTAEHRGWYDGWCPSLLHAQARAALATERLRFGNAMLLGSQHDPVALADAATTLQTLTGGRVELGLGLGYRDVEFDTVGLRRDRRGRMLDDGLETMLDRWDAEARPRIWIGGMTAAALRRAAAGGHGLVLPQSLFPEELTRLKDGFVQLSEMPGPIGVLRDVWIEPDADLAAQARRLLQIHYREEAGSWWRLGDGIGFARPEALRKQLERLDRTALIGSAAQVAAGLRALWSAGAELIVARVAFDVFSDSAVHEQLTRLALDVGPLLTVHADEPRRETVA